MNVLVLGAGPSGLLAAEAARRQGVEVTVISKGNGEGARKSPLHGCQYLHAPTILEGVPGTPVNYKLIGTSEGYRAKVYGPTYAGPVSVDEYGTGSPHLAWDLRKAYDVLWRYWGPQVVTGDLSPRTMYEILNMQEFDLVLSTVPAPALCVDMENHGFASEQVWAIGQREDQTASGLLECPDNTVLCNGEADAGWYRKARVFGVTTVEWPHQEGKRKPPFEGIVQVSKPLRTDCECWVGNGVVRLGRYGKWQKGYLAHQAWEDATQAVERLRATGRQEALW